MTPDSDTYTHILLNGLLWYVLFLGYPTFRLVRDARRRWGSYRDWNRAQAQRTNLQIHAGLYKNVRVIPEQRSAR